jgi:hypothetical protein
MHMNIPNTSDGETLRLADLVRRQHPSLDTMLLQPSIEFQTRTVAMETLTREVTECLAESFRHRRPDDFPMLYFGWGKCRVGSTALTNLFGLAGMPSYYQPMKVLLRDALLGRPVTPWIIPSALDHPHIFSKETAGPYVLAEDLFIALQPLIEAGYPHDKLHVIMLDREPATALASWLDKWTCRAPVNTLVQNYIVAALNAIRVESYANRQGIPVTHYVYEASKEAVSSIRVLFDRLGLASHFTEDAVTDWGEAGQLQSKSSRIIFPDEQAFYTTAGIHGSDTAYRYRARETASLNEAQLDMLERCGVNEVYRASVVACARDLGLSASTSEKLFRHAVGVAA